MENQDNIKINEKILSEVARKINAASKVLVVCHRRPDGDALGSMSAMIDYLIAQDKQVVAFSRDGVPEGLLFLKHTEKIVSDLNNRVLEGVDLIIALDTSILSFSGAEEDIKSLQNNGVSLIVVDHHASNEGYGDFNLVDSYASSTTNIIYYILKLWKFDINSDMASALLFGLVTDTNNFTNGATNSEALETAAELVRLGARHSLLVREAQKQEHKEFFRFWSQILLRLKKSDRFNFAYSVILGSDIGVGEIDLVDGVANFFNYLNDTEVVMVVRDTGREEIKISLRSNGGVDVSEFSKWFGGGGHKRAAGFSIKGRLEKEGDGWRVI